MPPCAPGAGWTAPSTGPVDRPSRRNAAGWGVVPRGEARITTGGNLKARYVIHTVGPVYRDGGHREPELLTSCYRESLKLASAQGIKSLAFPSISTGVYGYPMEDAARVALKTVKDYLAHHPEIERVRFVLFGRAAYEVYERSSTGKW